MRPIRELLSGWRTGGDWTQQMAGSGAREGVKAAAELGEATGAGSGTGAGAGAGAGTAAGTVAGTGAPRVLVVAGTHGNERNAPWLIQQWRQRPELLQRHGLEVELEIGNPAAFAAQRRYIERDLNRTFQSELLADSSQQGVEVQRARQLLERFGPGGPKACPVALDLHSTTAAMGNSLVVYGRRPADLALAAALQHRLGLPIYLHEGDASQVGYLVEQWPCGLVIEVGPVAQGLVTAAICRQSQLALEAALASLAEARSGQLQLPASLVVHRHCGSIDLPRDGSGEPIAMLHPSLQGRDWQPLGTAAPIFCLADGGVLRLGDLQVDRGDGPGASHWPVFINEAAYGEKGIAFSLTERQRLACDPTWAQALADLLA